MLDRIFQGILQPSTAKRTLQNEHQIQEPRVREESRDQWKCAGTDVMMSGISKSGNENTAMHIYENMITPWVMVPSGK